MKVWTETGGVRVGRTHLWSFNATWPLGRLTARSDRIEIAYGFGRVSLQREYLERIECHRGLFSKGIRLRHTSQDAPQLVVFWSCNLRKLVTNLQTLGFERYLAPSLIELAGPEGEHNPA